MIGLIPDELKSCWIQTYTGRKFFPFAPNTIDVDIIDIAHALSNICRFNGHSQHFYTVAQHSCIVARQCAPQNKLWGLLHDAAEAYIQDLVRPIKRAMGRGVYEQAEAQLQLAIAEKFNLPTTLPEEVKYWDDVILRTEQRDIMISASGEAHEWHWERPVEPLPDAQRIYPWPQHIIEQYFMEEYKRLAL